MFSPVRIAREKFQPGSIKGTIFTLLSATLGAGMLAMPRAFLESGIAFTFAQMLVCSLMSYLSLISLVYCAQKTQLFTFGQLGYFIYGTPFKIFVEICNILFVFGTAVSYSVYLKENMV
jgi:amino acid permease